MPIEVLRPLQERAEPLGRTLGYRRGHAALAWRREPVPDLAGPLRRGARRAGAAPATGPGAGVSEAPLQRVGEGGEVGLPGVARPGEDRERAPLDVRACDRPEVFDPERDAGGRLWALPLHGGLRLSRRRRSRAGPGSDPRGRPRSSPRLAGTRGRGTAGGGPLLRRLVPPAGSWYGSRRRRSHGRVPPPPRPSPRRSRSGTRPAGAPPRRGPLRFPRVRRDTRVVRASLSVISSGAVQDRAAGREPPRGKRAP